MIAVLEVMICGQLRPAIVRAILFEIRNTALPWSPKPNFQRFEDNKSNRVPHPLNQGGDAMKQERSKQNEAEQESHDDSEARLNDQDPGERQKENQNQQKDDPLAA